ncbi:hypothetical protein FIE12Z_6286, partial [Fusarium flagelliforme]
MCRANCVDTRCVVCDWPINKTFDVMVHCEVFWQTQRCPKAEYPTTYPQARAELCGRCNPQWREDVDMQPQEDVDMQEEAEARGSDKTLSVERAEPNSRFKELIDEVSRRSADEDEKNERNRSDEL